ncbi:Protein MAM3 [Neolecta irregularis DAH-3]|uniref:Protein MAM3 n=1 Tax=Neolecta irregularis (strain DAH-3) TaxID=1198029 RepID=A0A1U7LM73_NEOID|nr:Protein MAM3 [Neolecta irregularis DAH-3]|eukprot:OLL23728.1 Protein MAM3 [Neolecta irregularis DAH-3]
MDRVLGGGWPAVLLSVGLVVVVGEVVPQAVCVRYGLRIGALFAPIVLALMYLSFPVSYPAALLLDCLLGDSHGTLYKKAGLKHLVMLHHSFGADRLNQDEVTIIQAVLDLREKPVGTIMTPMLDVFTMAADTVMNEQAILSAGYSRIPIHAPGRPLDFVGMLLVKTLITYDPEDALPVSSFALATLPETKPDTSCLDILNFFQEGKSHMVLVSRFPGESHGALGVLTLEDVIEELIGEEIVDETDVFIDIPRGLKRHPYSYKFPPRNTENQPLKPLAPSNKASKPINTKNPSVTIKYGSLQSLRSPPPNHGPRTSAGSDSLISDGPFRDRTCDSDSLARDSPFRDRTSGSDSLARDDPFRDSVDLADTSFKNPPSSIIQTGPITETTRLINGIAKLVVGTSPPLNV